jgi:hypothetical protein
MQGMSMVEEDLALLLRNLSAFPNAAQVGAALMG